MISNFLFVIKSSFSNHFEFLQDQSRDFTRRHKKQSENTTAIICMSTPSKTASSKFTILNVGTQFTRMFFTDHLFTGNQMSPITRQPAFGFGDQSSKTCSILLCNCAKLAGSLIFRPVATYLKVVRRKSELITKTSLCNEDPLTPHFYIVKLGCTWVYIFFLFLL